MAGLDAIAAGADIVLVAGVEVQTTVSAREGGIFLLDIYYSRQRSIDDFTFPALFGRRAKAYLRAFGVTTSRLIQSRLSLWKCQQKSKAHMKAAKMDAKTAASSLSF